MVFQYCRFIPLFLLAFVLNSNSYAQTSQVTALDPSAGSNPKVEAAAKRFVGSWTLFTPQWGSWNVDFKNAIEAPDGKVQLQAFENYDPAKPSRLTVEVFDGGGLIFHYFRPSCKGMPDVTERGIHLMKFKPINDAGTKLEATMLSKDCSLKVAVQLFKN
jgi:hypothetical protein